MSSNQAYQLPLRRVGLDVSIWEKARILNPETISIGDSVIIDDFVFIMSGEETRIGSFVHIGAHSSVVGGGVFVMEDFAGLSGGIRIYTGNEDYLGGSLTNPAVPAPYRTPIRSAVTMRKHSIIGANSVVLPGVTIGEGAAVGACSVVSRDCEPWTIYAGSPARAIRPRPREKMLELESQLRAALYDKGGAYIPKANRP
jgi:galactoside O-acetyltransferase